MYDEVDVLQHEGIFLTLLLIGNLHINGVIQIRNSTPVRPEVSNLILKERGLLSNQQEPQLIPPVQLS